MPSIKTRITKKILPFIFSRWSGGTIEERRARQDESMDRFNLPEDVRWEPFEIAGTYAEWIQSPDTSGGVILYLHGGAYTLGSVRMYRGIMAQLSVATRRRVLGINYRLAPENPYPAGLEDALAAYRWMLDQGITPSQIIIAGDSAGGGLTLATLIVLRDAGEPLPAGAVCISPWTDLTMSSSTIQTKMDVELILNLDTLQTSAAGYAGSQELTDPLISPFYADHTGLPPLLIQVGTDEILLDDAVKLAEKAQAVGVEVELETFEGLFHCFHIFFFLPEAQQAMDQIARFTTKYEKGTSQ